MPDLHKDILSARDMTPQETEWLYRFNDNPREAMPMDEGSKRVSQVVDNSRSAYKVIGCCLCDFRTTSVEAFIHHVNTAHEPPIVATGQPPQGWTIEQMDAAFWWYVAGVISTIAAFAVAWMMS